MGAVIRIGLDQLPDALKLGEVKIRRAVARGALAGAHRGRALIVRKTPRDQGQMAASWRVEPGAVEFTSMAATLAELVNDAPHVVIVEVGARPHTVSPEGWLAIYEWVRRHHRGGKMGGGGRMRPRRSAFVGLTPFRGDDPVISSITNAIVRKIKREGQKPTFFVREALPDLRAVMGRELEIALARASADTSRGRGRR